jgi:imidazoleglycerol phosphate synthase glutamine amidotransferase subunit HisH
MAMSPEIAILNHGLGNFFNVKRACAAVGMEVTIT